MDEELLKSWLRDGGYWFEERRCFVVNCSAPWDTPSASDRVPGSGVLGVLYVSDGLLHFEWRWDCHYDEHKTFEEFEDFVRFYEGFLKNGY